MYSQDYWQAKMRNKNVAKMAMLPMISVAAALARIASTLWHPWSRKRTKQLRAISMRLNERANDMRRNGLGWAAGILQDEQRAGYILSTNSFKRYLGEVNEGESYPNHVPALISASMAALFCVRDIAIKISKIEHDENACVWVDELIEELSEFPIDAHLPHISDQALMALGDCGVLLECEGLTYMLALIEDRYTRAVGRAKRKKSSLSETELFRLAEQVGVDPAILKDVLETEGSSWWQRSEAYKEGAKTAAETFFALTFPQPSDALLLERWQTGSVSSGDSDVVCRDGESFLGCETIVCMLITLFLSCRGAFAAENFATLTKGPHMTPLISSS